MDFAFMLWGGIFVGSVLFVAFILTKQKNNATVEEEWEFEEKHSRS